MKGSLIMFDYFSSGPKAIDPPEPRLEGHTVLDPATMPHGHDDYGYSGYGHGPELQHDVFNGHTVEQTSQELAKFFSERSW